MIRNGTLAVLVTALLVLVTAQYVGLRVAASLNHTAAHMLAEAGR